MDPTIKVKVGDVEVRPIDINSFKTQAVKTVWEAVKSRIEPGSAFLLLHHSSSSYEAYSYLISYISKFIEHDDRDALAEMWQFISDIPSDVIDFVLGAKIPSLIHQDLHSIIYASYLMALRMGWLRSPRITMLHGSRELAQLAMQHSSMSVFRDLESANELLAEMLRSSFRAIYGLDEASLINVEPQHLVRAAIQLCYGRRQFNEGMSKGALMAFPAQEMIRALQGEQYDSNEEAFWRKKWIAAGGKLFNNRIVALKNDPIWRNISRFGKPYPPFDFNSCMNVFDVGRRECIELGIVSNGEQLKKNCKCTTASLKSIADKHNDKNNGCFKSLFIFVLMLGILIYAAYRLGFINESMLRMFK